MTRIALLWLLAVPAFLPEDLDKRVEEVRALLPGEGFTILVEEPFIVVGDEAEAVVRRRAKSTVRWAVDRLREAFFPKDPKVILTIWLFKDKESYETNAVKLFGRKPTTKYGYYSSADRALVMNIETGGGTLVHEMVHPFVEANHPKCPSWLNEGMGSLFEQCADVEGEIRGLTNWRLAGLQEAIRADSLPSIKTLASMSSLTFYGEGRGVNYAMARYLLYYLQETGLLRDYWKKAVGAAKDDPSGYDSLVAILGEKDMDEFRRTWEKWVLALKFGS